MKGEMQHSKLVQLAMWAHVYVVIFKALNAPIKIKNSFFPMFLKIGAFKRALYLIDVSTSYLKKAPHFTHVANRVCDDNSLNDFYNELYKRTLFAPR